MVLFHFNLPLIYHLIYQINFSNALRNDWSVSRIRQFTVLCIRLWFSLSENDIKYHTNLSLTFLFLYTSKHEMHKLVSIYLKTGVCSFPFVSKYQSVCASIDWKILTRSTWFDYIQLDRYLFPKTNQLYNSLNFNRLKLMFYIVENK